MAKVYKTAEEQLKQGSINGYDFRLTQLSLLNSELTLMQLQFALKAIEINLNRLSGKVLEAYV
jgi:outer membrane protein TolC